MRSKRLPFGEKKMQLSRMGLGMAALGRPGYINLGHGEDLEGDYAPSVMEGRAHNILDMAWEKGVRYFDTARSYGQGEAFLGSWLQKRALNPQEVTVGSKWGYTYTANWRITVEKHEVKEHSLPVLDRQWEESKNSLGSYLDLYQIHSATLESGVLENTEVLNKLATLKQSGIAIGLSLSGTNQGEVLQKAMEIQLDGKPLFDSVQATYNLLEVSVGSVLRQAFEAGWTIIIKEALANGRLTARNGQKDFEESMRLLSHFAQEQGVSIDAIALAGVLAKPWANIVLSGAANVQHLLSNLKALDVDWNSDLEENLVRIKESPDVYWQKRKSLVWN